MPLDAEMYRPVLLLIVAAAFAVGHGSAQTQEREVFLFSIIIYVVDYVRYSGFENVYGK